MIKQPDPKTIDRLKEAVERLLIYAELHAQQNPGWNGNRTDDIAFAKSVLSEVA